MRYLATRVLILLLAFSLGISSCKPIARSHYDHLTEEEEEEDKPNWKKRALFFSSAALITIGGWRLAKYLDHILGRGIMVRAEKAALASRETAPMFYKGKFDKPPLYKLIAPDGSEHWLLGTFHITGISLDDFPVNSKVFEAVNESSAVLFEVDMESLWQIRKAIVEGIKIQTAYKTANFNLRSVLGDNYMGKLLSEFDSTKRLEFSQQGIDLEKLSPSQAYNLLNEASKVMAFGEQGAAIDVQLMRRSRQAGKKVVALEKGSEAAEILKKLAAIEVPVARLLKFIDDGGIRHNATKLLKARDAWGQGDLESIRTLFDRSSGVITEELEKLVIDDRNLNWVKSQKIQRNCQQGKKCTIVVGLGHLFEGENSLSKLLSAEGFKIEKVY